MADDIKKGDVVRLKTGGPEMTVELVFEGGSMLSGKQIEAKCMWFDNQVLKWHNIVVDTLVKVPHSEDPGFEERVRTIIEKVNKEKERASRYQSKR